MDTALVFFDIQCPIMHVLSWLCGTFFNWRSSNLQLGQYAWSARSLNEVSPTCIRKLFAWLHNHGWDHDIIILIVCTKWSRGMFILIKDNVIIPHTQFNQLYPGHVGCWRSEVLGRHISSPVYSILWATWEILCIWDIPYALCMGVLHTPTCMGTLHICALMNTYMHDVNVLWL